MASTLSPAQQVGHAWAQDALKMFACRICDMPTTVRLGKPGGVVINHCERCGSTSAMNRLDQTEPLYGDGYYEAGPLLFEKESTDFVLRTLQAHISDRGIAIDIGCGTGASLAAARAAGLTEVGCDPSEAACRLAKRHSRRVIRAHADALPFRPCVAVAVTMLDVIAHVDIPLRTVRAACELLSPGGRLLVKTPRRPSWVYQLSKLLPYRIARSLLHLPHQKHSISMRGLASMLVGEGLSPTNVFASAEVVSLRMRSRAGRKAVLRGFADAVISASVGSAALIGVGTRAT